MSGQTLNKLNAAVFAFVQSLLPFLVLIGVLDWTSDTIAAAMLVVTNFLTVVGLIFAMSDQTNT